MRGKMDCHGMTDPGRVREVNEDQFLIADLNKSMLVHQSSLRLEDHTRLFGGTEGRLFVVADGMGGHAAGERASSLAVDTVTRYVLNTLPWFLRLQGGEENDLQEELKSALARCQDRIEAEASAHAERHGMGTTLTMAYLVWPRLYVVHAGDSRCYLLRGERIEQVTHDHTMAQKLVEAGALRPEEAESSRWSHMLWNCLGGGSHDLSVDLHKATLQVGDTLLLCSDGLSKCVPDKQIAQTLERGESAEAACRSLVAAANEAGGPDNITAIVAYFRTLEQAQEQAHAHQEQVLAGNGEETAVGAAAHDLNQSSAPLSPPAWASAASPSTRASRSILYCASFDVMLRRDRPQIWAQRLTWPCVRASALRM
jgi:protein phosphatase